MATYTGNKSTQASIAINDLRSAWKVNIST